MRFLSGFADLQSAASKNAVAGLGITTPRFSLKITLKSAE